MLIDPLGTLTGAGLMMGISGQKRFLFVFLFFVFFVFSEEVLITERDGEKEGFS